MDRGRADDTLPDSSFFSSDLLRTLGRYGWRGDDLDYLLVDTLRRKGFTLAQIAQAYRDVHQAQVGRARVPRAVRYRVLRLPQGCLGEVLSSPRSLTSWYNEVHLGGRNLRNVG